MDWYSAKPNVDLNQKPSESAMTGRPKQEIKTLKSFLQLETCHVKTTGEKFAPRERTSKEVPKEQTKDLLTTLSGRI